MLTSKKMLYLCSVGMRSSLVFPLLLSCFFLPWIAASISFYYSNKLPALITNRQPPCGILFPYGAHMSNTLNADRQHWVLLGVKPAPHSSFERFILWEQQSALFPLFLKNQNLEAVFLQPTELSQADFSLFQRHINWDLETEGGCFLVNPSGYISLAFSYDDSPKQAFFTIKKIVSS